MAPSFRALFDYILDEIALCGAQGASSSDILAWIDAFYSKSNDSQRNHAVDRPFQEKVWSWLTRNPEVSVGTDKQGNHLSLSDVEHLAASDHPTDPASWRVFVSQERTWLAITGHEPDESKVFPTEFTLLSVIASAKSNGIIQPELVKLSGQDKRSVPRRTDVLQKKGYIIKSAIQIKGTRTSLCTLRKFLGDKPASQPGDATDESQSGEIIDLGLFLTQLFDVLREYKLIFRNDLKKVMGCTGAWRWGVLSRALRKFERIGVLKRVRALSQYADTTKSFHPCIMLVRDPSERDLELFHEYGQNLLAGLKQENRERLEEVNDDLEPDDTMQEPVSLANMEIEGDAKREGNVEEAGRHLPTWTPDRNIHNQIFETVDRKGTLGLTSHNVISLLFGNFFRKPVENMLLRLVDCWQLSQPPHLRHLAIVRDTAMMRRMTHYVHYSAKNFQLLVDAGQASWEAVEYAPKGGKADPPHVPAVDAVPQLDPYGLPQIASTSELLRNGNAALLECVTVGKPEDYIRSNSDVKAVQLEDGTYTLRYGLTNRRPGALQRVDTADYLRCWGRPKSAPNTAKAEPQDNPDLTLGEPADVTIPKPRRQKKLTCEERFEGMPEKEKLEAMGLDETWTEYSVHLIERSKPGVYITARGRRRPAGKKRGRPKISRVAVFKSPKLSSFPWFRAENEDHEVKGSIGSQQVSGTDRIESPIATPGLRGATVSDGPSERITVRQAARDETLQLPTTPIGSEKRSLHTNPLDTEPTPESVEEMEKRPYKRRRLGGPGDLDPQDAAMSMVRVVENSQSANDGTAGLPADRPADEARSNQPKRKRPADDQGRDAAEMLGVASERVTDTSQVNRNADKAPGQDEAEGPLAKKPRREPEVLRSVAEGTDPENAAARDNLPPPSNADTNRGADSARVEQEKPIGNCHITPPEETPEPSGAHDCSRTPETQRRRVKRINADKGGSVALLRRKIVIDIVEKAGGAFPLGTEIWYTFTTAWGKMRHKEIPDMRTVRTVVKNLVDAGKLRQMTFSGRDSKGVMVTKTIITKPDLQPNDPVIKDLQSNMLAESKLYFPPNTDVDPTLTKSGSGRKSNERFKLPVPLPVETGMTVQLHEKPVSVLKDEEKRGRRIGRQLLRTLESEDDLRQSRPGVIRLMKIQRPSTHDPSVIAPTSIARPVPGVDESGKRIPKRHSGGALAGEIVPQGIRRTKRPWRPISTIAPYAMFMNPSQTFHARTGTFSTNAGIGAVARPDLPESLSDLLGRIRQRKRSPISADLVQPFDRFSSESDAILRWELRNGEILQEKSTNFRYINQTIEDPFEAAQIDGDIRFDYDEGGAWVPDREPMTTRQKALWRFIAKAVPEAASSWPRRRSRETDEDQFIQDEVDHRRQASRRRNRNVNAAPQSRRLTKLNESVNAGEHRMAPTAAPAHRPIVRRRFTLSPSLVQRIMTAIVVIRTLAGGFEAKIVDWNILPKAFPTHDPKVIQERGRSLLNRHRLQLAKMQSDFQERFIEAYARDEVPRIDYENLDGYDWEGVVDWAHTHLEAPSSQKLPDLPATREQFDSLFELREEPPVSIDELYQVTHTVTVSRKRVLPAGVAFAVPLVCESKPGKPELSRLEVAKTWIRANVTAPEETYQSAEALKALRRFEDPLVESALQSLVTDRAISMGNRGRITPGRNYDVTDHFLITLGRRRAIEHTQLRRAARFKTKILDPELQARGSFDVDYHAEDGDILTLINLAAAGKLTLKPRDPPQDKFGLTEGGYDTRQVDKEKLRFTVEVRPIAGSYVYGNPLQDRISSVALPCPPRVAVSPTVSLPEKIPIWIDIHGQFNKLLWDQVVAAIVGCVATRPGISAKAITNMIQPTMGTWEVHMLLEWMAGVGVTRHESKDSGQEQPGWRVEEWWWMVLGWSADGESASMA